MSDEIIKPSDGGFGDVFSSGLPSMVGIVTLIAQPVVQAKSSLQWPGWLPYAVAIVVSGLLAYYRLKVIRRSAPTESAVLMLLLTLVIFSAYVTGNNVVYYTKEGYARPGAAGGPSNAELEAVKTERELLKQKLQSAEELIRVLRDVVPGAAGKPRSFLPSLLAMLETLGPDRAWAQEPPAQPGGRRPEKLTPQQVQDMLKKYDAQQRELDWKLKETLKEQEKTQMQQSPPLLKSW